MDRGAHQAWLIPSRLILFFPLENQLLPQGQKRSGSLCPWRVCPPHLGSRSSVPLGYGQNCFLSKFIC